ncbi:MAG TPA: DNA polymerase domain-containing protein [Actinomycetota bacterium]|nr:DNA polymerase domain-containing protein [Actinomycetota bacterium]
MPARKELLDVAGREVAVSNPEKIFFPELGLTKLDLVRYYLAVADGALRAVGGRPMALKRYVHGAAGEFFFQKRAPDPRPEWIETVELKFPSGRTAHEIVVRDAAQLAWIVNLGCIDLNPHPVRASDLDHPDELRVDLDPVPGVDWEQILDVALATREVLEDFGLTGWPKTSGSRGFHVYARIEPRWTFPEVRRAAVALAREVERREPHLATSKWWKEERHGVFLDYNQNAKDRTVASGYSVRPTPDGRVSAPLAWDEVPGCDPAAFTITTVPERFTSIGDPWAGIDDAPGSLDALLELSDQHEEAGFADAPWPPQYEKQPNEPRRVQPSKRRGGAPTPEGIVPAPAPGKSSGPTGRRRSTMPLVEIARAATQEEALAGLDRWKERHPEVVPHLEPPDVLVDSMRGRSTTWTRIRVNLQHVPEQDRPEQEPLEVDYDPWAGIDWSKIDPEGIHRPR